MKLPFLEHAFVPSAKLVDYLLSPTHPVGKSKAQFFAAFGFDAANAVDLERQFILIAQTEDVYMTISSPYGEKYVVRVYCKRRMDARHSSRLSGLSNMARIDRALSPPIQPDS